MKTLEEWMKEKNIADYGPHLEPIIRLTWKAAQREMMLMELQRPPTLDLQRFLQDFHNWSLATFGTGKRTSAVLQHIRRELAEVEREPDELSEWVDVILLAFNGAMRRGATPRQVCAALVAKHLINQDRLWPATGADDEVMEHIRTDSQDQPSIMFPSPIGTPDWGYSSIDLRTICPRCGEEGPFAPQGYCSKGHQQQ